MSGQRYSIIPGDAVIDQRVKDTHLRVLTILGRHTDRNGWCKVSQKKIADQIGKSRETVNRAVKQLCELGYLRKTNQYSQSEGQSISLYQVVMDRTPDIQDVDAPEQDEVPPCDASITPPVTPEDHTPCDTATSHLNDPSFNDHPPTPQGGQADRFSLVWEAWPESKRPENEAATEAIFNKLSPAHRDMAAMYAAKFVAMAERREESPLMIPYLKTKAFLEFDGADTEGGYFKCLPGSPEWAAWEKHISQQHHERGIEYMQQQGKWLTETRWPPAKVAA